MAGKYHTGMTQRLRERARDLGQFGYADIERQETTVKVKQVVYGFLKTGEVRRIRPGLFEYVGKQKQRTLLDIVWHLVRSHRRFTTDEMERLSGAQRPTVLEYLHCLKHLGYLRHTPRSDGWQMINDPGPDTPVNTTKCQKLRRMRATQKEG